MAALALLHWLFSGVVSGVALRSEAYEYVFMLIRNHRIKKVHVPSNFSYTFCPFYSLPFCLSRSWLTHLRLVRFRKPTYPQTDPIFSAIIPMVSSEFLTDLQWLRGVQESLECELPDAIHHTLNSDHLMCLGVRSRPLVLMVRVFPLWLSTS